jgi:hypothetical protein
MSIQLVEPKAYLIVAYYNRDKWRSASPEALEQAEDAAEDLFPETETPLAALAKQGEFIPHTFASDLFAKVADSYGKLQTALQTAVRTAVQTTLEKQSQERLLGSSTAALAVAREDILAGAINDISRDVRDQIVDRIYATQPPETPVGWMVVVDKEHFPAYIQRMRGAGNEKGLWAVFDIEIFPLEDWSEEQIRSKVPQLSEDKTTQQIYDFMTPTSWGR